MKPGEQFRCHGTGGPVQPPGLVAIVIWNALVTLPGLQLPFKRVATSSRSCVTPASSMRTSRHTPVHLNTQQCRSHLNQALHITFRLHSLHWIHSIFLSYSLDTLVSIQSPEHRHPVPFEMFWSIWAILTGWQEWHWTSGRNPTHFWKIY